jgi:peptidoglycan/LPS O-acetylase OafA/YrhL
MLFIDALRALASLLILLHHFALYPPLCENAKPILGAVVDWIRDYARMTQVFFVIGGYLMAHTMSSRAWGLPTVGRFLVHRYCRLGIPYLVAIFLAISACWYGRGWLPEEVVGKPPTLGQFVAHLFFLQEILGYEHLSAGIWFVCINIQLGLVYSMIYFLRDILPRWHGFHGIAKGVDIPMILGWGISLFSLFYFNLHSKWDLWAIYFFPYFFMGVVVHRALHIKRYEGEFWFYIIVVVVAMAFEWRWRMASAVLVGLLLFVACKSSFGTRWPKSRIIAQMGKVSYSLFLVHYPVLILVASTWERHSWTSPSQAVVGLFMAFVLSVAVSFIFQRYIELPVARLIRKSPH